MKIEFSDKKPIIYAYSFWKNFQRDKQKIVEKKPKYLSKDI